MKTPSWKEESMVFRRVLGKFSSFPIASRYFFDWTRATFKNLLVLL
jgi:hypothetical protein